MLTFRTWLTVAAAALGAAALGPSPAAAQGWYDNGYSRGWGYSDPYQGPRYGYNNFNVGAGVTDIAICPPGYHLGRSGRLCWPD